MKYIDRTGQKFNLLTAVSLIPGSKTRWKCKCDCGNTTYVLSNNLVSGKVKSCGCLLHKTKETHHKSNTRLYRIYAHMKNRCLSPAVPAYPRYGGRGIKLCDEWKNSFESFYEWAIKSGYHEDLSIDRIDNNGDYCPENCRWASPYQQSNNRRSCIMITRCGKTQSLKQWCDELGISYKTVHQRINAYGWDANKALSVPVKERKNQRK